MTGKRSLGRLALNGAAERAALPLSHIMMHACSTYPFRCPCLPHKSLLVHLSWFFAGKDRSFGRNIAGVPGGGPGMYHRWGPKNSSWDGFLWRVLPSNEFSTPLCGSLMQFEKNWQFSSCPVRVLFGSEIHEFPLMCFSLSFSPNAIINLRESDSGAFFSLLCLLGGEIFNKTQCLKRSLQGTSCPPCKWKFRTTVYNNEFHRFLHTPPLLQL